MTAITNRYDFVLIFDVENGNPNGDPDAGNLPRVDPETGRGLVTDVCLKRKIRNYVEMMNRENARIYIKEKAILNKIHEEAHNATGGTIESSDEEAKGKKAGKTKRKGGDNVDNARQWMCEQFYDVRTFGAVMSTGVNCGQVRGPVQMTFAHSIDPVLTQEHAITRMAVATETEAEKQDGDNRTMGRKNTIPYGLYMGYGFISPHLAAQTGFSQDDLELFWESLVNMFEHDRSAARGLMTTRNLFIFQHESALGNAPARTLFDLVNVKRTIEKLPARAYSDYTISVEENLLPRGVTFLQKP